MKRKETYYDRLIGFAFWIMALGQLVSCQKSPFLNKKPNTDLIVPTTLADFQALLDNDLVIGLTPVLGDVSADNFYLTTSFWQELDVVEKNAYVWAPDVYQGQGNVQDWDVPYQQVFYANVVLEGLSKMPPDSTNASEWRNLKGAALFTRAYAFYNLAQLFAPLYDAASAGTDPGIPLRLASDVTTTSSRASVKDTYSQILQDLQIAGTLLSPAIPFANLNRPSQPAVQALMARVYLSMRNYPAAGAHADSSLGANSNLRLIDYNSLDSTSGLPIPRENTETIYQSMFLNYTVALAGLVHAEQCVIDSMLYRSYDSNDLRKVIFYRTPLNAPDSPLLKGGYAASIYPFSGLAIDEMYLVRAECAARAGNTEAAADGLNVLLTHRYKTNTFAGFSFSSVQGALDTVLLERRKELAFRGLRWTDLRRLNKDGANITLTRKLGTAIFILPPNSPLYTLPIPPDVPIPQNPRP
jgi:starch-binding outer membrane protein, SusD/RagB family